MRGTIRHRLRRTFLLLFLAVDVLLGAWWLWRYHGPVPQREIFRGITYGCERLPDTDQSGGLLHWVCADLNVPGVSMYTTPLDPQAQDKGFEYRLQHTSTFVSAHGLAAAVNGTLFASDSGYIRLPGDLAISSETVVSNHVANHVDPNTYLLWWDDGNNAHMELSKPPPQAALDGAKWGIGGQARALLPGNLNNQTQADARTMIAADPVSRRVWIACFDKASYHFAAKTLADRGASFGVVVDGGTSVAMVLGDKAKNVRPGTVTGNWRPVATHFGFMADPLP